MNYKKIYYDLMSKARTRELKDVYVEKHHVFPRCMGGLDYSTNIVKLLAREHFIAHELLVKIYPTNYNLLCAVWRMCNDKKHKISNRQYEKLKLSWISKLSEKMKGDNNPSKTYEAREKISNALKGKKKTKEHVEKMKLARKGITQTEESNIKRREKLKDKKRPAEVKIKIGIANKGKKRTDEVKNAKSKSMLGSKNQNFGREWSDETNEKRRTSMKGHPNYRSPYYVKKVK